MTPGELLLWVAGAVEGRRYWRGMAAWIINWMCATTPGIKHVPGVQELLGEEPDEVDVAGLGPDGIRALMAARRREESH